MNRKLTYTAIMVVIFVLSFLMIEGKDFNLTDFKKQAPELLNLNNAGTEFWLTFNPAPETAGGKNELKLYVVSGFTTTVTALNYSRNYLEQKQIKPFEITEFTLTPYQGQCYSKADTEPPQSDAVYGGCGEQYAIHVYADIPFICFAVTQYQDKGEGYLAMPVQSLGNEYIVSSWADDSDNLTSYHPSYISIVSAYDNNIISLTLGGTPGTKSKGGLQTGNSCNFNLGKGNILLIASDGQGTDFSGTRILSSKPIAVISSNYCADVPENIGNCNFITEMEVPTNTWGQTYFYTPIYTRRNNSYVKIFAKEAGTNIFRDSNQIASLSTGGGYIDSGWVKLRAAEGSPRPIIFTGDKPINVVQYNCGEFDDSIPFKPFMMNLTSLEQFQKEIIFCTPEKLTGEIYNTHYVNVVYESSEGEFFPDDLMFAKYEDSVFNWKKVGNLTNVRGVQLIGKINDKYYYYTSIQLYESGVYKLKADNPLTAYAYGFSDNLSYGFTVNTSLNDDTLAPKPTYVFYQCLGETSDELVEDMPQDNSRSNLGVITYNADLSYNFRFSYEDFVPGEDSSTRWDAWVIDRNNDARAVITFSDWAGNDTTITLNYYARKLAVRPELDFGVFPIGDAKDMTTWIINESTTEAVVIDSLSLKYNNQGFELINANLPFLLQPLDSIPITVRFTANENGEYKDSIGVGDTCGRFNFESKIIAKVGIPMIDVSYYDYCDVPVNSSASGSIEIRNIGTTELVITGYTGPRKQPVIFIPDLVIEPSNPLRLAPNQVFTYEVRFLPTDTIAYTDSMFFISNSIKNDNVDSVGDLNGKGLNPILYANCYDWGYKRIDRPEFPAGPYDPDNGYEVIKLWNGSSQPVFINDIIIKSDINGNAFQFDRFMFSNIILSESSYILVPVKFHPTVPGPHELIIEYDNSAGSTTQTILRGYGIVPRILAEDIDFGSSLLNDYTNPVKKKVRFTNLPLYAWRYGDTLTISDLLVKPIGDEISTGSFWGTEGFRFNKGFISFPVKLAQGESLEFEAEFVAVKESQSIANLESVSDAETDVSSKWTGNGIIDGVFENLSSDNQIGLYPNPADDFLLINFKDDARKSDFVRLFDYYGNVVYENRNINDMNLKIRTSELASGMYFLQIGNGRMITRKVVVVH
ncbi:MAG: hypothetical protein A2X61_12770 [Ignavibacteria bacterium GWB2_35_12]|nr:MAG: hypothetical protein A2X63_02625 [Ignavibacteria bacterium GWA2_35_8]OGU41498.1 MAG: hypothetical protein A2X61_12770 [Ignavibacteria bacterium GWB2_35_12]OGU92986.1 MAG: hypothetical protein A2220_15695 [Ignavibacteria bacterium RIFOXYA2_FULL_35_10]OGV22972.1 MAG: hypothetical protein A2475_10240 [Ignavibacteria bacterium RIFOXYC2_FULL_35_21]